MLAPILVPNHQLNKGRVKPGMYVYPHPNYKPSKNPDGSYSGYFLLCDTDTATKRICREYGNTFNVTIHLGNVDIDKFVKKMWEGCQAKTNDIWEKDGILYQVYNTQFNLPKGWYITVQPLKLQSQYINIDSMEGYKLLKRTK